MVAALSKSSLFCPLPNSAFAFYFLPWFYIASRLLNCFKTTLTLTYSVILPLFSYTALSWPSTSSDIHSFPNIYICPLNLLLIILNTSEDSFFTCWDIPIAACKRKRTSAKMFPKKSPSKSPKETPAKSSTKSLKKSASHKKVLEPLQLENPPQTHISPRDTADGMSSNALNHTSNTSTSHTSNSFLDLTPDKQEKHLETLRKIRKMTHEELQEFAQKNGVHIRKSASWS